MLAAQPPGFSTQKAAEIALDFYGLSGTISPLDSERDQNFLLDSPAGERFVIKISNRAADPAVLEMQLNALEHIARVDPGLPVPRVIYSRDKLALTQVQSGDGATHFVHVLTYMPGCNPDDSPVDRRLFRPAGACLARLDLALRGFFHPAGNYDLLWDLKQAAKLRGYLHHILTRSTSVC